MSKVVYVCSEEYTGKPDKTPVRVKGDKRRADELNKKWSTKHRYNRTDKYLN